MEITIKRPAIQDSPRTISKLFVDGEYFCDTIEDKDRGLKQTDSLEHILATKVKHETAIPAGRYELVISFSARFQRLLPLLINVPGYEGIRIHPGNTESDSSGCICPGKSNGTKVLQSILAFNRLFTLVKKKIKVEKIYVNIIYE